jgi:hypothetical protein
MTLSLCGWEAFSTPGASPTLGSLGPSHQWRHKPRMSLRGPPCAHGVAATPHGEVRNTSPLFPSTKYVMVPQHGPFSLHTMLEGP